MPLKPEQDGRPRAVIENVRPEIDCGRFPVKRIVGDFIAVEADVFADGHDVVRAVLLYRHESAAEWSEAIMLPVGNDRWRGEYPVTDLGRYRYTVKAWIDHLATWQRDMNKRISAGQETKLDYQIGEQLKANPDALRFDSVYDRELAVIVEPVKARCSAWYEFFPRSAGTFRDCEARLDYAASMGFDVVYLPPIHPIGLTFRKGKNNTVNPEPGDPGSPWAIGSKEGGHKDLHPELGTLADFQRFVAKATSLGIDIALDIAFQVSPDHPYVANHPEWFRKRPDGTIQYAENPPKKYQDIYPFDFETPEWQALWKELKSVFEYWIENGVRIFRVDNPHTKSFSFWEWAITEIKCAHPDVLFLSEAFTRPKVMYRLAKLGFSQSYTYFPWRHGKQEIIDYFNEITQAEVREYFRPNHWPNTPDILTEFLQAGGRPGFYQRLVLAATLGANYGIYGPAFELCESKPLRSGSEEYLHSEKYQVRAWDLDQPGNLRDVITQVNRIRKENPALQNDWSLQFHNIENEQLLAYSKRSMEGNWIIIIVNLDPRHRHGGYLHLPEPGPYQAEELLSGDRSFWHGRPYIELDPGVQSASIYRVERRIRNERDFDYYL